MRRVAEAALSWQDESANAAMASRVIGSRVRFIGLGLSSKAPREARRRQLGVVRALACSFQGGPYWTTTLHVPKALNALPFRARSTRTSMVFLGPLPAAFASANPSSR